MSALLLALHTGHRTKVTHTSFFVLFFRFSFFVCLFVRTFHIFYIYI